MVLCWIGTIAMNISPELTTHILETTKANAISRQCVIQELWSGYGHISRLYLSGGEYDTVVIKHIQYPKELNHPRGWNTQISHLRKVKSYEVENRWYQHYSKQCTTECRVPECLGFIEVNAKEKLLILEDLDSTGYSLRRSKLKVEESKTVLRWLANFHAIHMNVTPNGLWKKGSYWHLETRKDEWETMNSGWLKDNAKVIDAQLNACQFQTIIHGDAKVANFCFSPDMTKVAAVDFQYVGGGCGMKDVAYFLGSCLSERECSESEGELLDCYFQELSIGLQKHHPAIDIHEVEKDYRALYAVAWTDFTRFLEGWSPDHKKLNTYSEVQMNKAFSIVDKQ